MGKRLLDLFCGAGGASMGYHLAGYDEIVGVDINPKVGKRYPFTFVEGDAFEYVAKYGHTFNTIHASPPCQQYSRLKGIKGRDMSKYPKLIGETRAALMENGLPFVIENVVGAPLENPLQLCGTMFGLATHRHRLFETWPWPIYLQPAGCNRARTIPRGKPTNRLAQYYNADAPMVTVAGHQFSRASGSAAMGIDWMTRDELAEAIPPAYTEYIGRWFLAIMEGKYAPDL